MESLVWSPVFNVIEEQIQSGNDIILIIVPFIKLDALKQLHWVQTSGAKLKIIVRWRIDDLISGASDIEIYPYLKEKGCQLYMQHFIHLKLYIFADNLAFNTSGNLTLRGLGYSDCPNIEVGNMVQLTSSDWINIYKLIRTSQQVDHSIYNQLKAQVDTHAVTQTFQPPPNLTASRLLYSISDLPATESPTDLATFYFSGSHSNLSSDTVRRAAHDIVTFGIPNNLSHAEFAVVLGESFRRSPFVQEFISFLKSNGSVRFGTVTDWIHNKCDDVPLPFRWEVKDSTRIFYTWLSQYFFPDVTWDVPGQRSQVIYWQKPIIV